MKTSNLIQLSNRKIILMLMGFISLFFINSPAQNQIEEPDTIRINTDLVSIKVRATDRKGRVVPLNPQGIKLLVDNQEQTFNFELGNIKHFNVLIDTSSSMNNSKIVKTIEAVSRLVASAQPDQSFSVYCFANQVQYLGEFDATKSKKLKEMLRQVKIDGETALYDAALKILKCPESNSENSALIIFTDGSDSVSKVTPDTLEKHLSLRNNLTYLIMLDERMSCREDSVYCGNDKSINEKAARNFQDIFQSVVFMVKDKEELYHLAASIPKETGILNIMFSPNEVTDRDAKHFIKILSNREDLQLFYRNSYYASVSFESAEFEKKEVLQRNPVNFKAFPQLSNEEITKLVNIYQSKTAEQILSALKNVKPDADSETAFNHLPDEWKQLIVQNKSTLLEKAIAEISKIGLNSYNYKVVNSATPTAISDSNCLILITAGMLQLAAKNDTDNPLEGIILHEMAHGLFASKSVQAKKDFNLAVNEQDIQKMEEARKVLAGIEIECDLIAAKLLISQGKSLNSFMKLLETTSQYQDVSNVVWHPSPFDRTQAIASLEKSVGN